MQGSQGPWSADNHESIFPEQPSNSISSLRQHSIPKEAPGGLRAVPVHCGKHRADCLAKGNIFCFISLTLLGTHTAGLTGNNTAAVDAQSPATWLPEGYDLEVDAALQGSALFWLDFILPLPWTNSCIFK